MLKSLFAFVLINTGNSSFVFAQHSLEGLIQAEKKFAAYSVMNGTKEAFLGSLDSNGIVFNEGRPINGISLWSRRERRPGVLDWRPRFAAISSSGDFGFTTGPWIYRQTAADTVSARGNYMTVWHIDAKGDWKFLVDLGVSNSPAVSDTSLVILRANTASHRSSVGSLLEAENSFIKKSAEPFYAYKRFLSPNAILNRNGQLPVQAQWDSTLFPRAVQYTILGSGIANGGDIGYIFGATVIDGKTDNYLRIWRREKSGWKILAEVLRY